MEKFFNQTNFSGGLSESDLIGSPGSFSNSFGIDIHTLPGVIQASWEPQNKDENHIIEELCLFAVDTSTGTSFWFGNSGTIYNVKVSGGVMSFGTVYQGGAVKGAGEFRNFVYWTTGQNVHRIKVNGNWTTDVVAYGSINSATYNPMVNMRSHLLIGSGTTLASVDDTGTITASGIPNVTLAAIPENYQITCLQKYGIDVLVGTKLTGGATGSKLYRWDLASPTWIQDIDVPETSVNCFLLTPNNTYFQAGQKGNLYSYNGISIAPYKKIPIVVPDNDSGNVMAYPQSSANFGSIGYFGITNQTVQAGAAGLYALGRKNNSYPISLSHQFPSSYSISTGSTTKLHIGAVISGIDATTTPPSPFLLFNWRNNNTASATYGMDAIFNPSIKCNPAWFETQAIGASSPNQKTFQNYNINYRAKPTNTSIALSYFKNFSSGSIVMNLTDKTDYNKLVSNQKIDAGAMKFRITLTSNADKTAEISEFYTDFDERSIL